MSNRRRTNETCPPPASVAGTFVTSLGLIVILGIYAVRLAQREASVRTMTLIGVSLTAIVGGLLGLTVTPTQHARLRGTVVDTFPAYASTLGGNDSVDIDLYYDIP